MSWLGAVTALPVVTLPVLALSLGSAAVAQPRVPAEALRAINLARTTIVRTNGGLSAYRPAQCMFTSPTADNPCLVRDDADGFLFHFVGGPPAWEQQNRLPTQETEVLVSPEGREVTRIVYNAAPRAAARAISLARTHAVTLNGGVAAYQPARCMVAPSARTANPCVLAADGSGYRFRFEGGTPGWQQDGRRADVETEITITADGRSVDRVIYNGEPR